MNSLPNELFPDIFTNLSPTDLASVCLVCDTLYQYAVNNLYHDLKITEDTYPIICNTLRNSSYLAAKVHSFVLLPANGRRWPAVSSSAGERQIRACNKALVKAYGVRHLDLRILPASASCDSKGLQAIDGCNFPSLAHFAFAIKTLDDFPVEFLTRHTWLTCLVVEPPWNMPDDIGDKLKVIPSGFLPHLTRLDVHSSMLGLAAGRAISHVRISPQLLADDDARCLAEVLRPLQLSTVPVVKLHVGLGLLRRASRSMAVISILSSVSHLVVDAVHGNFLEDIVPGVLVNLPQVIRCTLHAQYQIPRAIFIDACKELFACVPNLQQIHIGWHRYPQTGVPLEPVEITELSRRAA